jgi:hypothetical protein
MRISELTPEQLRATKKKYTSYKINTVARSSRTVEDFETWYYRKLNLGLEPWRDLRAATKNARSQLRYARHRAQARYRNIDFDFTWEAWHAWWQSHGIDKNTQPVQRGSQRLCMCRYGDQGAYTVSNVYLATHSDNTSDAARNGRHRGGRPRGSKNRPKG